MVVILHNIRSLQNVGAIFRTADAAGVEKIYLCGITPSPFDELGRLRTQLTKVSLGAEKYIEWEHYKSTTRLIDRLKNESYRIFAIEQSKKAVPYYKIKLKNLKTNKTKNLKIALILGSEISGLSDAILKKCDKILEIPMRGIMIRQAHHPKRRGGGKESLNVSVAFGIVVFSLSN